ncbi:uncharacterized protein LOC143048542 [Mytilus galloprovincialis]|uniref:uncharacterized protein LOC143048542 n=1 Tax=Mytilus galloprovincialis TaxID=29158 RepID=UPI003F7BBD9C
MTLPGGPMEICFSFDTTGSMSGCINEVKGNVQDMIQRLQADIPGIRMAVFAHGDYCDKHNYITKHIDFSTNVAELCTWVKNVGSTGGGDGDECYELVLQNVQKLSWTPGSKRALVMIGDADPHEPGYKYGGKTYKIDWRKEAYQLMTMNVRIYGVQCRGYSSTKDFYKKMSTATDGKCLELADFSNMFDFMMAICYREHDETLLQNYEKEVRARGSTVHKDLDALFGKLRSDADVMDTVPAPITKIPSLTKPGSIKALKPTPKPVLKKTIKTKALRFKPKHDKLKDKRKNGLFDKYKLQNLPKLKRENVPETNFMLNSAHWSKWQVAMVSSVPADEEHKWEKRHGDSEGYRRKVICGGSYKKPTLYEFAVQNGERCRRYVVYCKSSKGFILDRGSWETRLLTKSDVKSQINDILKKDMRLFVRSCPLMKSQDKLLALNHYDYAWSNKGSIRTVKHIDV